MLLTIDIGNSATKFGVFDRAKLVRRIQIPTLRRQTAAQLSNSLVSQLDGNFSAVVVSSVVPQLNTAYRELAEKLLNLTPVFVDNTFDFGFEVRYFPPESAGADRLVAAFAAREKYGAPVVVCDFGTALNIEVVNSRNEYLGGVIAPGIEALAEALFIKASKLPRIEIKKPAAVVGNSTVGCIESGIFYGFAGLAEGILKRIIDELTEKPQTIATGGYAELMAENCSLIETVDENLMLDGLRLIYEKTARRTDLRNGLKIN